MNNDINMHREFKFTEMMKYKHDQLLRRKKGPDFSKCNNGPIQNITRLA